MALQASMPLHRLVWLIDADAEFGATAVGAQNQLKTNSIRSAK
jgi:hypothetical protein